MRYENRLASKVAKQEELKQQQEKLRKKFHVREDEIGIIKVVKKRISEIFIDQIDSLIKTALRILICLLAIIGVLALLYPDTRLIMYSLGLDLIDQALKLLGG